MTIAVCFHVTRAKLPSPGAVSCLRFVLLASIALAGLSCSQPPTDHSPNANAIAKHTAPKNMQHDTPHKSEVIVAGSPAKLVSIAVDEGKLPETYRPKQIPQDIWDLFDSCQDRTKERLTAQDWDNVVENQHHILVRFSNPLVWNKTRRGEQKLDAILLPLEAPYNGTQVWARLGDTVYSPFIACDPTVLARIINL